MLVVALCMGGGLALGLARHHRAMRRRRRERAVSLRVVQMLGAQPVAPVEDARAKEVQEKLRTPGDCAPQLSGERTKSSVCATSMLGTMSSDETERRSYELLSENSSV